ncbi:MAG: tetratricopeptide repeat protein, partial [Deltaproteobacteria bacterium]|nr:tetratricopeptide repeat protein [Deltaproteobacteria bacterium]
MKALALAPILALSLFLGCAPALTKLPTPSGAADPSSPAPTRLDPEVMSRFLAAQLLLASSQGSTGDARAEEAANLIQQALALEPEAPQLWQALAEARARSGDYGAASGAARQAVILDPDDGRSRYLLGELLHRLGELEEAETHLRVATERGLGGDDPHLPHYYLYFVLRELGRADASLAALDGWIDKLPEDSYPTILKARLLLEHGRLEEARVAALVALQRAPGSEDALGVYLDTFRVGLTAESPWGWRDGVRLPDAVAGLEEVLRSDWSRARLHRVLLSLYRRMGRYDRAEEHLRFVRILGRERERSLNRTGIELFIRQHRNVEAGRAIEAELASEGLGSDDRVELIRLRAQSLEDMGDLDGALGALAEVPTDHARYGRAAQEQVRLLMRRGEPAQAASAAITARAVVANRDADAHAGLQDAALRARIALGDLEGARALLPELERLGPERAEAARTALLLAEGKGDRAASLLRDRLSRAPANESVVIALSQVLADLGQIEEALAVLDAGVVALDSREQGQISGATPAAAQTVRARTDRQRIDLWTQRARVLQDAEMIDEAAASLEHILAMRPQSADTLNFLGYLLANGSRRLDDAEQYLTAAIEQRPFSGAVV